MRDDKSAENRFSNSNPNSLNAEPQQAQGPPVGAQGFQQQGQAQGQPFPGYPGQASYPGQQPFPNQGQVQYPGQPPFTGQQQQPQQPFSGQPQQAGYQLPPQLQAQLQQLQNQLVQAQQNAQNAHALMAKEKARADEYVTLSQRLQADFDNYRKRTKEENKRLREDGIIEVIEKVVNALDVFKHAINMITDEKILEGVKMIYRQFSDVLASFGVTEIMALGEQFDPELHNCVVTVKVKEKENSGIIVEVLQKGYIMGSRVIRHAAVKVAK